MSESKTSTLTSGWLESQKTEFQSIIANKLGSSNDPAIDDIWQELLLAAEKNGQSAEQPEAWVRQVINHKVADYLRAKQRCQRLEQSISETSVPNDVNPTPFDWLLTLENRQQVQDALAKCSSENRELLRLKFFSEQTVAQIATQLNISHKAAEYRLHRAKQEFRQKIVNT